MRPCAGSATAPRRWRQGRRWGNVSLKSAAEPVRITLVATLGGRLRRENGVSPKSQPLTAKRSGQTSKAQRRSPRAVARWLKRCKAREAALLQAHARSGLTMTAMAAELGFRAARVGQLMARAQRERLAGGLTNEAASISPRRRHRAAWARQEGAVRPGPLRASGLPSRGPLARGAGLRGGRWQRGARARTPALGSRLGPWCRRPARPAGGSPCPGRR